MKYAHDEEKELLIKHIVEFNELQKHWSKKRTSANIIANAIIRLASAYAAEFRNKKGGWICGSYKNILKRRLSYEVGEKFTEDTCNLLVDYCERRFQQTMRTERDKEMEDMLSTLLEMMPVVPVNIGASRLLSKENE